LPVIVNILHVVVAAAVVVAVQVYLLFGRTYYRFCVKSV
jgi:hypothetical protein